jgi:hypothetical protein
VPWSKRKFPTPEQLLLEVQGKGAAKTYEFDEYIEVVDELHRKDYSFADIADYLEKRLGISVNRGQVYRAHRIWLNEKSRAELDALEAMENEEDQEEGAEIGSAYAEVTEGAAHEIIGLLDIFIKSHPGTDYSKVFKRVLSLLESRKLDEGAADEADRHKTLQKEARANAHTSY